MTNTIWGGIILIVLGLLSFGLAIVPKKSRGLTSGNIKLVMSGAGFIILGIVIIVRFFE